MSTTFYIGSDTDFSQTSPLSLEDEMMPTSSRAVSQSGNFSDLVSGKIDQWYELHNDEAGRGRDNEMSKREIRSFAEDASLSEDEQAIAEYIYENRNELDLDGNGRLDRGEFTDAVNKAVNQHTATAPVSFSSGGSSNVNTLYERHNDEAGNRRDNEMSKREIKSLTLDDSLSSEEKAAADYIYDNRNVFDTDSNGRLSREEFVKAFDDALSSNLPRGDAGKDSPTTGGSSSGGGSNSDNPSSDSSRGTPPGGAKSLNWGGEKVDLWDITKDNANRSGITDGADVFLVTVNDTNLNKVGDLARDNGYEVVKTEGNSDAGVLLLRPTKDADAKGFDELLDYGKVTVTAVNEPEGRRLTPNGGGFETRLNDSIGFGTTDNPETRGEFFKTTGGNSTIEKNREDDGRLWHSGDDVRGFRGGWMGLEWR